MLTTRKEAVVVAGAAVQRNQDGTYVWLAGPDGSVAIRSVAIDIIQDDEAVVIRGLGPGERVVVAGHSRLRPGVMVMPSKNSVQSNLAQSVAGEIR